MSKQLQKYDGPVFGITNSLELFQKLKHDSLNLRKNWHSYDAFNFLVTSWHLFYDWKNSDPRNALSREKRDKNKLPKEMNLVLDIVRDFANGSKHFKLDEKSENKRRVDEVHVGDEAGLYEYFFHENLLAVTVDEHWYFSIRVLHNIVMSYFDWVFDDGIPVKQFPDAVKETILYCNIANRETGEPPEIWLLNADN